MDQNCLPSTSHQCSIELRSGEFGKQINALVVVFYKPFLNYFFNVDTRSCWKKTLPLIELGLHQCLGTVLSTAGRWTLSQVGWITGSEGILWGLREFCSIFHRETLSREGFGLDFLCHWHSVSPGSRVTLKRPRNRAYWVCKQSWVMISFYGNSSKGQG